MRTFIVLCWSAKERRKCRQIVPWNHSDSRWRGSFPGRQERRKEDNRRCCHFTQYVQVHGKPHHHHPTKRISPPDSGVSSDTDVWRAIHDVVWKHMEEITQPKKGRFSHSCVTPSNWILKKNLGNEDVKASYCTTVRENVFSKGKPFPCPYNFGKFISIRLTLLMIDR